MLFEQFELERCQSQWENVVEYNLAESGIDPVTLSALKELGLDMNALETTPLSYIQSNGTIELRQALSKLYPGAGIDHIQVTNGSSEANLMTCLTLVKPGDEVVFQAPNYYQFFGMPRGLGASIKTFRLLSDRQWAPDWDEFDEAVTEKTRMIYVSHPNNPTGAVLGREAMERIVAKLDETDTILLADEVYQGAELEGPITPSFWGMSDRVVVTSGLSKAYGIPGARIGWIVGQPDFLNDCWSQHDYTTICVGTLNDLIARTAVAPENRQRLFARTRRILAEGRSIFRNWVDSFEGFLGYTEPQAGAIAFVKYNSEMPSIELIHQIRKNQNVLVVPGTHMGMEGYLRFSIGLPREYLETALARVKVELDRIRASATAG